MTHGEQSGNALFMRAAQRMENISCNTCGCPSIICSASMIQEVECAERAIIWESSKKTGQQAKAKRSVS